VTRGKTPNTGSEKNTKQPTKRGRDRRTWAAASQRLAKKVVPRAKTNNAIYKEKLTKRRSKAISVKKHENEKMKEKLETRKKYQNRRSSSSEKKKITLNRLG